MARPAGMLLEATERDILPGENRLTEILASVLEAVPAYASRLLAEVGLETACARFEVSTQVFAEGKFVDMEVLGLDERGAVVSRLWSEHKDWAGFSPGQMENYEKRLGSLPGNGRLIAVVRHPRVGTNEIAWQRIAELADQVGHDRGGGGWRADALDTDAPAQQLLLAELIAYLERRELAFMDPLETAHILVIEGADDTADVLDALMQRGAQHMELTAAPKLGMTKSEFGRRWIGLSGPAECWATDAGGWPELMSATSDYWRDDSVAVDSPCFGAGFTFEKKVGARLLAPELADWRAELAEATASVGEDGEYVRCYRTLYMTELIPAGVTLESQAQRLGAWAQESIDYLARIAPPTGFTIKA